MSRNAAKPFFLLLPPIVILLVAWAVFIRHLGLESMWYDENISWWLATRPTLGDLLAQWPLGTGHPPFYFATLWAWIKWTGSADLTVMRLSSTIPMLLTVAVVYRLSREWFASRWAGLAAMLFLATTGVTIYYARELRMYGLLVLLAVVSWWLLRRWAERGHRRTLLLYALVVTLMAYTHYLAAALVAVQALAVLLLYRRRFPALLAAYVLTALLVLPWIPTFIAQQEAASLRAGQVGSIGQFNATEPTTWRNIGELIQLYSAGQVSFVVALLALGVALGLSRANSRRTRRHVFLALLWLVGPAALVLVVNLVVPLFNPRYIQWILPALALLVGVGVARIPSPARLPLLAIIGISGAVFHTAAFEAPKIPHRELLTTVAAQFQPGDRVWYNFSLGALGSNTDEEVRYYLQEVVPSLSNADFVWDAPKDFSDPDVTRIWDIRPYFIPMADVAATALGDREMVEERQFGAYFVRLYAPRPANDTPAAQFGDLFALTPASSLSGEVNAGDDLTVNLWMRALEAPRLDYSYVLVLRRDGDSAPVAQWDGGLAMNAMPTSAWSPDAGYELVSLPVTLSEGTPPGVYTLWLGVYYWEDPQRLPVAADAGLTVDPDANLVRVLTLEVHE